MSNIKTKEFRNAIIYNPVDHIVYEDRMGKLDDDVYGNPIFNSKQYSLAAAAKSSDAYKVTDAFYGEYADQTNDVIAKVESAKQQKDRSLAAAIISSKEYTLLQDSVVLGTNEELIKTGILTQIFEEIATPNLKGDWGTFANDVRYFSNIPESKSPEPTMGTYSETSIEVPKSGGAVAITERARQVINGGEVFNRLVGQLLQKRLQSESKVVRDAIEAIAATNNTAGVDFGARTGSPPASTTNPIDTLIAIVNFFDGTNGRWDGFVSNALPYLEYVNNDIVRGSNSNSTPAPVGSVDESAGPFPGATGVTWYRDNLMTTLTEGYAFDRSRAGKNFRGPTRAYTVTDPDLETEKYVTKSHFATYIVDGTVIARITGIQA